MNIQIMIPDDVVRTMLATGRRMQGTISLANMKEGNFHPHRRHPPVYDPDRKEIMLRCGKAVATRKKFRLTLDVSRDHVEFPALTIMDDCKEAGAFFDYYGE